MVKIIGVCLSIIILKPGETFGKNPNTDVDGLPLYNYLIYN